MMLSLCSSSSFQVSFNAGSRAFVHFPKAFESGHILQDRILCSQDGIHTQDMSLTTNSTRFMHTLVVETPDAPSSSDSSIFSPYPNNIDDIVLGYPDKVIDNLPDDLSCSVAMENRLYPFSEDIKYIASSDTINLSDGGSLDVKESIDNFISGVTKSLDTSIDRAQSVVKSSYDSLVSSYSNTVKSATESVEKSLNGFFSSVENSTGQASKEVAGASFKLQENISKTGTLATDVLRRAIILVEDSLSKAGTFIVYSYGSAKAFLPPDYRNAINVSEEKIAEVLSPVGGAIQQIYLVIEGFEKNLGLDPSDPVVPFFLFLGGSVTLGTSYWLFTYGGYSGDLDPESTLELLRNEKNAVLIDVRPEDLRKRDGVPDLRREARSKYASVSVPEIGGSLRKLLKGGKDLDDALTAVVIRNLKLVKDGSKVIVMDANGSRSKSIARSLKKYGVKNTYLVKGGFASWRKKGLRVKELKPETALTVLNEEAEAILEEIKPTPTLIFGFGLGAIAAGYALLEWEKTLQVIGILGLGQTLYRRLASYEKADDFNQDVRLLLTPVKVGAQAVSWAAGKLEPNKIGLPTSPSSTAVQDRVLKVAAKHESQPSAAGDAQGLPGDASSSKGNENLDLSEA